MTDVFIRYKREEHATARALAAALAQRGWTVWWDPRLRAGEHFDDAIEQAILAARCVIVLWSKLSTKSRYVKDEANLALTLEKLVPVAIESVDVPFRFRGLHTIQLIGWSSSSTSKAFDDLIGQLTERLAVQIAPPPSSSSPPVLPEVIREFQDTLPMYRCPSCQTVFRAWPQQVAVIEEQRLEYFRCGNCSGLISVSSNRLA